MRAENDHDDLKFGTTNEKVDFKLLITRVKKETLLLRDDAEETLLQDEHEMLKEQINKGHKVSTLEGIIKCEDNEESMSQEHGNEIDEHDGNDADVNRQKNNRAIYHKENDDNLNDKCKSNGRDKKKRKSLK